MAVGWNFSQGGNLRGVLFVLLYGSWGRWGRGGPVPHTGRVDPRKPGSYWGVGASGIGARVLGRWGVSESVKGTAERYGIQPEHRPLWVEEPARRHPLPDPVRAAAVRALIIISVTLIEAMVAFLCTMAESWPAFPMVISSVVSTVAATWAVVDVWVTRQVWNQRHGVVSEPSSTARALRRERRARRRAERRALREQDRIRRRGGAGQLSHP
ncbi:hypothetical protein [Streptomyces sp. NPDC091383]|uniref:hypothetical protein n=1 Tax=Streptomyces sp. NPDC091383 TaxID=3365996 RepID=UPI0037F84056